MNAHSTLFLSQSYQDAQEEYRKVLLSQDRPRWDYIILTASDDCQAEGYRAQLHERAEALPQGTHFAVLPDEGNQRVGSGGATLSVLRYIRAREPSFEGLRILVIHSGGDSKRVPQYSALGKLFSPVPHVLHINGKEKNSTLFDEFMIAMAPVPGRIPGGMLLLSGDVLLLFNPLLIDYQGRGAAAVSFKEAVATGKNHGVFLRGENGLVRRFLHKQSEETLRARGAVNDRGEVDIDTGAVLFSPGMLESLYALVDSEEKYHSLVNPAVRLSLYGDFQYPLAEDSTLEEFYREAPEGEFCEELLRARGLVWQALRPYRMKLIRLAPARFIHFGTSREILRLMTGDIASYQALGWERQAGCSIQGDTAGVNAVQEGEGIGRDVYLEASYIHAQARVGSRSIISCMELKDEEVPQNVVMHGLRQRDGRFVCRLFGVEDNPKEGRLFGLPLEDALQKAGISPEMVWEKGEERTLWTARLYPVCGQMREAAAASLDLYRILTDGGDTKAWRLAERTSLCTGFHLADPQALIAWDRRMADLVRINRVARAAVDGTPARTLAGTLKAPLSPRQEAWLSERLLRGGWAEQMRLHYYVGTALGGSAGEKELSESFSVLSDAVLRDTRSRLTENTEARIVRQKAEVRLPLRVNFGGGWSDTPPYCIERGGTVLNAAILLNGQEPVCVTLERLDEPKIVFDSRDMDVHGEFTSLAPLQRTGDPFDPFALQKAALLSAGVIPPKGGDLREVLSRLGGGFIMRSEVRQVPKGSGLGTSSILAGACVKCLFEFLGLPCDEPLLYRTVLAMEQLMSTGGGWQDQVGGLTPGFKYITSRPGLDQSLRVEHLALPDKTTETLRRRFALIYTGQRRLARHLLRDVVGRYIGCEKDSLYALNEIQRTAALMRFELERGHVDDFAALLTEHWRLSRMVDEGSTNTLIDQIFLSVDDLIAGRMICGAGGGGFLQVVLKEGVSRQALRDRLRGVFADSDVDVWPCELI